LEDSAKLSLLPHRVFEIPTVLIAGFLRGEAGSGGLAVGRMILHFATSGGTLSVTNRPARFAFMKAMDYPDIKTTMIYVSLGKSHIREQVERLNMIAIPKTACAQSR
jgi:hypothetical protein